MFKIRTGYVTMTPSPISKHEVTTAMEPSQPYHGSRRCHVLDAEKRGETAAITERATANSSLLGNGTRTGTAPVTVELQSQPDNNPEGSGRNKTLTASSRSGANMSAKERAAMLRQRNAVYSRRKYYKKKMEVSSLEAIKIDLETDNQRLQVENMRLATLFIEANQKINAMRKYPGSQASMTRSFSGQRSASIPAFPLNVTTMGSTGCEESSIFSMGRNLFGGIASDPYLLQDGRMNGLLLQLERNMLGLQSRPGLILPNLSMPASPLYRASCPPGFSTILSGPDLMRYTAAVSAFSNHTSVPILPRFLNTRQLGELSATDNCISTDDAGSGERAD
jgi:hypothetical protein